MNEKMTSFNKRKQRVRAKLRSVSKRKFRLSVFKSNAHMCAQIINDEIGATIVSASSLEKEFRSKRNGVNIDVASEIGKLLATRAIAKDISEVIFDRGACLYHGKIKALADGAREVGLKF